MIILDEAQMIYHLGFGSYFWRQIKRILGEPRPLLKIVLFSAYGERPSGENNNSKGVRGTPVEIPKESCWGLEDIRFTRKEFQELVTKWNDGIRKEILVPITPSTNISLEYLQIFRS